jgi:hypothetical protein
VKQNLSLDIMNSDGTVIKSYSNKTKSVNAKAERDMATNAEIYTVNSKLSNTPGYHRFTWDMRHFGAWDKSSTRKYQNGPYASQGVYMARLITSSDTVTQDFVLKTDPRVTAAGISQDDIAEQEELALKVTSLLSEAKRLASDVAKKSKAFKSKESKESKQLTALNDRLTRSKGRYTQVKFINQVGYLLGVISGADKRPGQDMYTRYQELKEELAGMQTEYNAIKSTTEAKTELKVNKKVINEK